MSNEIPASKLKVVCSLPNGCTLYREAHEVGAPRYWSDESGRVMIVWDTALASEVTLLAAIVEEHRRVRMSKTNER